MSGIKSRGKYHAIYLSIQDPKQIVSCIDFRYITDVLTEEEALGETGFWRHRSESVSSTVWEMQCYQNAPSVFILFLDILVKAQEGKKQRGEHTNYCLFRNQPEPFQSP